MSRTRMKGLGFGLATALAVLAACSRDGGYRSPTAPSPPPLQPSPDASQYVGYLGEATNGQGQQYSRPWKVKISGNAIVLLLDWGDRTEYFDGNIVNREFSAVAYPPYLDACCDATEERLVGVFSEDFGSFEATTISIIGKPEVERWETRWRARRL